MSKEAEITKEIKARLELFDAWLSEYTEGNVLLMNEIGVQLDSHISFAESYHQSRINRITDEMIAEKRPKGLDYYFTKTEKAGYKCAVQDLKYILKKLKS